MSAAAAGGEGPALRPDRAPDWLAPLVRACDGLGDDDVSGRRRRDPDPDGDGPDLDATGVREAAVLALFADDGPDGPDVLVIERAADLRAHAGQAALPGGAWEVGDPDLVATALREAAEETGVDPTSTVPLAALPALTIPVTGFTVTPVIAHWTRPAPVGVVDPGEVAAVLRVPVATLADPAHRFRVRGPAGYEGPAFGLDGLLIWGFTAGLLSWMLELGGWARPWDTDDVRGLDEAWRACRERATGPARRGPGEVGHDGDRARRRGEPPTGAFGPGGHDGGDR